MAATDPAIKDWVDANAAWLHYGAPVLGAVIVVAVGKWLRRAMTRRTMRAHRGPAAAGDQDAERGWHRWPRPPPRVLLVADDSEASLRGVGRFVEEVSTRRTVAVDLLNVQPPVHRDVSKFVEEQAVKGLHHEEGMKAIEPARAALERAGVPHVVHIGVGDFTHVTVHYAKECGRAGCT